MNVETGCAGLVGNAAPDLVDDRSPDSSSDEEQCCSAQGQQCGQEEGKAMRKEGDEESGSDDHSGDECNVVGSICEAAQIGLVLKNVSR